jgi:hypothetical protein
MTPGPSVRKRLGAAGLDAGEVQQCVDQFQEAKRVAKRDLKAFALNSGQACRSVGQGILDRAEHQGQGRAELVADIAEECGLRLIEFGQHLGAPTLRLIRHGFGKRGGHRGREQVEKAAICFVQRQARTDAGHEESGREFRSGQDDRQDQRRLRRIWIGGAGQRAEPGRQVIHLGRPTGPDHLREGPRRFRWGFQIDKLRACRRARRQACTGGQPDRPAAGDPVELHEGQIEVVLGQDLGSHGEHFLDGPGLSRAVGEIAQGARTPFAQQFARHFRHGVEQPADAAGLVPDRTEREGEECLLQIAVAVEEHPLVLKIRRLTG